MSRKDYVRFASMLDALRGECDQNTLETVAREMCRIFRMDNPNFDQARFLEACGIEAS